ncbi:MAG: hypothetical protein Kow00106_09650 [Anaerolineae bacterium]
MHLLLPLRRGWPPMAAVLVTVLLLSACGAEDRAATPTAAPAADVLDTPSSSVALPLPAGPAPVDGDYRADSAALVGATGRPQLLEFFTYW